MDTGIDIASASSEPPIERLTPVPALSQRVHLTLERLIITRQLQPGMRLVEGDLAQNLGVSRGPIREALQRLAQDGFVELRPRQGAFVHEPTTEEIDNFYDVRRVLEAESARLAALHITEEGANRLRECLARAEVSLAHRKDPATTVEDLHKIIATVGRNQLLSQYLSLLSKRADWYMAPFEPQRRRRAWDEHKVIVDAIIAGDPKKAVAAMIAHVDSGREQLKQL